MKRSAPIRPRRRADALQRPGAEALAWLGVVGLVFDRGQRLKFGKVHGRAVFAEILKSRRLSGENAETASSAKPALS